MYGAPLPKLVPAAVRRADQHAQMDALLVEDDSQRNITSAMGVARVTITKQLKKVATPPLPLPSQHPKKTLKKRWEALEISKIGSFVNSKKRKIWLWLVVGRVKQRIVG